MLGSLNISRRVLLVLAIGMATPAFVSVQSLINFRHLLLEQRKAEVRHLDEAAWATVAGYQHEAAAGVLTEREAQDAAKSAVRSMRYDGANYFFIWDLQGTGIAHGGNAKLEGKNFISGPDAAQSPGVADMVGKLVRIARDEHEGFARYMIPKAGQTIPLEKIGYSKLFAPWGWAIGTGAYVADIDAIFWSEARADLIMTTLLTMLAGVVSYLLGRDLSLSIRRLTGAMKRLAEGNLSANIPSLARRDEVGVMARAVNIFKDSAIRKQELEAEKAAEQKTTADSADLVVSSIGKCLERLAAGDLTDRLHASLPQAYQKLGTDMNSAMGQLDYLVQSIVANTTAIRSGTSEIAHAADDLSQRTEQQASRLESTAAALNEITATVNQTAESSNQAREIVSAAREDAERGEAIVREAIGAMATIEQSSHEIGQIVSVIDQIAFQTNLLALNAGIEAAQAGEAGRGFEIVASEVRALARRSAEAANAIKTLVSASSQQVTRGVHLVGETGQALGRIAGEVGAINAMVVKIAVAAQDQAAGLHQVNASVHHMDLVTQQNAELAAQSTAACHALMQESEKLSQLTGRFRIADVKQPAARSATPHDSVGVSRKLKSTTRAVAAAGDEGPRARRLAG